MGASEFPEITRSQLIVSPCWTSIQSHALINCLHYCRLADRDLNLSHAYQQIQSTVTINTHSGLFQYKRSIFGVASAPSIIQCAMENLLQRTPGTCVYILVPGCMSAERLDHLGYLAEVLCRLQDAGWNWGGPSVRISCQWWTISAEGLHTSETKGEGNLKAQVPQNVAEPSLFLSLVTIISPGPCHHPIPTVRSPLETTEWT